MTYGDGSDVPDLVDGKPNLHVYVDADGHRHTGVMASLMRGVDVEEIKRRVPSQSFANPASEQILRIKNPNSGLSIDAITDSETFLKTNQIPWAKMTMNPDPFISADMFIEFRDEEEE